VTRSTHRTARPILESRPATSPTSSGRAWPPQGDYPLATTCALSRTDSTSDPGNGRRTPGPSARTAAGHLSGSTNDRPDATSTSAPTSGTALLQAGGASTDNDTLTHGSHLKPSKPRSILPIVQAGASLDELRQNDPVNHDELSVRFQTDMKRAVDLMARELNYHPTVFIRMLSDHGAVGAAKRLLSTSGYQYGFEKLFENHRLEYSVEAFVILPWYQPLFTFEEIQTAEERLGLVEFDIAAYLARVAPSGWA